MSKLAVVKDLLDEGFAVFPIARNGKLPLTKWSEDGLVDSKGEAERWWSQFPDDNIGISCGPSALYVVDLDGPTGLENWNVMWRKHEQHRWSDWTRVVTTASGGFHLYFNMPRKPLGNSAGKLAKNVDTRGRGGMVVAPGSLINSHYYEWYNQQPIQELPEWLEVMLRKHEVPAIAKMKKAPWPSAKAKRRLRLCVNEIMSHPHGSRNENLNTQAWRMRRAVDALGYDYVLTELLYAALESGLDDDESRRTIRSGLGADDDDH